MISILKFVLLQSLLSIAYGLSYVKTLPTVPSRISMNTVEGRRYASYNLYKGKGAVAIKIISPTWTPVPNGNSFTVSKEGGLFFEMAPSTANQREYDWSKKINFFMSATECGTLLYKAYDGVQFFHDTGAQTEKAGQLTKTMKWAPMKDGFYLSISQADQINPEKSGQISISVFFGEFMVIETIIRDSIPKFLGIDQAFGRPGVVNYGGKDEAIPSPPPPPAWLPIADDN